MTRSERRIVRFERRVIGRKKHAEDERAPLWLVGVTDLVTLLLAFFILLFATSVPKTETWNAASDSMRTRFGGDKNITLATGQAGHMDADTTWKSEERNPGLNLDYLYSLVRSYIKSDPSLSDVYVWYDKKAVILSLGENLTFESGKADVSSGGKLLLRKLSDYVDTLPNTLEVIGYTDAKPLLSDVHFSSNRHLSLVRAQRVAQAIRQRGYKNDIWIRGKGVTDTDAAGMPVLPGALADQLDDQSLSPHMAKEKADRLARRVDLRLHLLQP